MNTRCPAVPSGGPRELAAACLVAPLPDPSLVDGIGGPFLCLSACRPRSLVGDASEDG